jgi:hypothetical protein
VASITDVIAPPAERPVTKIRAASISCDRRIASTIALIDAASPDPRWVSVGENQLKQSIGLLARLCSGNSKAKPCRSASCDQPDPVS